MKLKIFKATLIAIAIATGAHTVARCQGITPEQEKELEAKVQQMEVKLQAMQIKLDSMKTHQKTVPESEIKNMAYAERDLERALKVIPKVQDVDKRMQDANRKMQDADRKFAESFREANKNMNFNFDYPDTKLDEKIKNGEVKQRIKTYTKSYPVGRDDKLMIDNRYGKVTVNTWNKNEFKVDVEIKADANTDDDAGKLLDGVNITDSREGPTVLFRTSFEKNKGDNTPRGMWTSNGKSGIRMVEINYTVYMPSKNALQIDNRFGAIELPDFDGKVTINSSFGSFTAKKLSNPVNEINTRGATTIESLVGSQLKVMYGSLSLGSSDNLNAEISYSPVKIDRIKTSGNIKVRYGSGLQIGNLDKSLKSLSVSSAYAPVSVDISNRQNFDFDVTVNNSSFDYGDHNVVVTSTLPNADNGNKWNSVKNYKGHLGKGDADKVLIIKASYMPVKFNLL